MIRAFRRWMLLLGVAPILGAPAVAAEVEWRQVEPGLMIAEFASPAAPPSGEGRITVLRIDPQRYAFRLLTAKESGGNPQPVRDWVHKNGLLAAINAGMYQEDGITSVGYMKNFGHVNNSHVNPNNAVFAFNPREEGLPPAQIIDRTCQDFEDLRRKYDSLIQSIRMISCDQRNVWDPQPQRWSMAAVALDKHGQVLFILTPLPYSVHDFIEVLLALPLSIHNAMYLEGGPRASLYLSAGGVELERVGGFPMPILENDTRMRALPVPNVIGIVRRAQP